MALLCFPLAPSTRTSLSLFVRDDGSRMNGPSLPADILYNLPLNKPMTKNDPFRGRLFLLFLFLRAGLFLGDALGLGSLRLGWFLDWRFLLGCWFLGLLRLGGSLLLRRRVWLGRRLWFCGDRG